MKLSDFSILLATVCAAIVDAHTSVATVSLSQSPLRIRDVANTTSSDTSSIVAKAEMEMKKGKGGEEKYDPDAHIQDKCCAVWSAWQGECLEITQNKNYECSKGNVNTKHVNDPPTGAYATPSDCAVWRIATKECLVKKQGYPGTYWSGEQKVVEGGQMD